MSETKNPDFVKELGYLGFTMRLKRISDAMMHEGRRLYQHLDVDIEPNWYVIFKLLAKYGSLSITEIAARIRMAHPSVITIVNKMIKSGYLNSERAEHDSRKRVLSLTNKATELLPSYETIWEAGEQGIEKALENTNILTIIDQLEQTFLSRGFKERTLEQLQLVEKK